ncbi:MAG: hypothetical protein N3A65_01910 [candidate division WOR-3 bacterium]|nr:hypothetical protein [candidate division WOR-3 bacterium]
MAKFWDDFSRWLEDASRVLSKEAGDLTMKGKLKLEIFELKRKSQELFQELGEVFYGFFPLKGNEDFKNDLRIKQIVQKIKRIKNEITKKEQEYKKIGQKK